MDTTLSIESDMEETKTTPEDIRLLVAAQISLKSIPTENQNIYYRRILKYIDDYLETHCNHHYIFDWVDINPETSKRICYCEHCFKEK